MPNISAQYIAGFFDGEGSVVLKTKSLCAYRLSIPQTNKEILEEIQKFFNCGKVYPIKKRKEHWKDAWVYQTLNNNDSLKILNEINPFLYIKREKSVKAIESINNWKKENKNCHIKEEKLKEALNFYKQGFGYKLSSKKANIYSQRESFRLYLSKNNLLRKRL